MHTTFRSIIDRWPKPSSRQFAEDINVPYVNARLMRYRNSISPKHWVDVVEAAQRRGFEEITHELLARLAAEQTKKLRATQGRKRGGHRSRAEVVAAA